MIELQANIVDIKKRRVFFGRLQADKKILSIGEIGPEQEGERYILPGFIDSHVHIESSMLVPAEFARLAVTHGTVATVSDPHEIANVCGMPGVQFMIDNGKTVPFKFCFGAPSCVPATAFETSGAVLDAADVDKLLQLPEIKYLSEMMNFPGVLSRETNVMQKIDSAKKNKKPVDGHAPGLEGEDAKNYIAAGISTDHECFTAHEALGKIKLGMKILIREGSAAKNFEALIDLLHEYPDQIMFCSDDKHPDSLEAGHINILCARAVAKGIDVFNVLQAACSNPEVHYKIGVGLLAINDAADFIVVDDLKNFQVRQTYIDGVLVAERGKAKFVTTSPAIINRFECDPTSPEDFKIIIEPKKNIHVIEALDGQLITNKLTVKSEFHEGRPTLGTANDILKIVVVNRYSKSPPSIAFIKNVGLRHGAIGSSVAHDSHNIVAVGADDNSISIAVNKIIEAKGGISAVSDQQVRLLALPVAGLMSDRDGITVARDYAAIDKFVKEEMGSSLSAPFMTLSFMALLVIPELKLSDQGLFDGKTFSFIPIQD